MTRRKLLSMLDTLFYKRKLTRVLVEVKQGKLLGTTGEDYHGGTFNKFLGIPYAKAPVGHLRYKVKISIYFFARYC